MTPSLPSDANHDPPTPRFVFDEELEIPGIPHPLQPLTGPGGRLIVEGEGSFDIRVRVPRWATRGFSVGVNGMERAVEAVPGTYVGLRRAWKRGDVIELHMPFSFHLSPLMDQPNIASIFYGPVLLCTEESAAREEWRPVTLDATDIGKSINGDPSTLRFRIGDVPLKPFFEMYGRHSVYFDVTLE